MKSEKHIDILNELKDLGAESLANMSCTVPYTTPEQYFEEFSQKVSSFYKNVPDEEILIDIQKLESPFVSPSEDYFKNLSSVLIDRVKTEEQSLAEIKEEWSKDLPFLVPTSYFDNLPNELYLKVKNKSHNTFSIYYTLRYAASLILLIFVGWSAYLANQKQNNNTIGAINALSQSEIANYINYNIDDFDTELILSNVSMSNEQHIQAQLNELSQQEIESFIQDEGIL